VKYRRPRKWLINRPCYVLLVRYVQRSGELSARIAVFLCVVILAGCVQESGLVLTRQVEARRLASELRVQFLKAADAANRAVMASSDEASRAAAEAAQATQAIQQNVETLEPILTSLGYADEIRHLDAFKARFAEYRALDSEILPLATENTNVKAQGLSFGPAREAGEAFANALEGAAKSATGSDVCCVDALAASARAGVLEVQVIQARHIAESDDVAMSRMETEMAAGVAVARNSLTKLRSLLPSAAASQLTAAAAALDRFETINAELVTLSRRNSNVRSLALSLGRKRIVTAECDDVLQALLDALAKHAFSATR
jgi:negative regulator of replication initiation